jgi:hypothetical protein
VQPEVELAVLRAKAEEERQLLKHLLDCNSWSDKHHVLLLLLLLLLAQL